VPDVLAGLAACWQVCSSAGSGLAAGVDRLEEGLRAAEAQRRAIETELAAPRATAGLLAVLPVGGVWLAAALGAHPIHVLLHTSLGIGCLFVGLALDGLGLMWTGRIVNRAGSG
jgi:tight adherence protein B